jgi:hypothetical protein
VDASTAVRSPWLSARNSRRRVLRDVDLGRQLGGTNLELWNDPIGLPNAFRSFTSSNVQSSVVCDTIITGLAELQADGPGVRHLRGGLPHGRVARSGGPVGRVGRWAGGPVGGSFAGRRQRGLLSNQNSRVKSSRRVWRRRAALRRVE